MNYCALVTGDISLSYQHSLCHEFVFVAVCYLVCSLLFVTLPALIWFQEVHLHPSVSRFCRIKPQTSWDHKSHSQLVILWIYFLFSCPARFTSKSLPSYRVCSWQKEEGETLKYQRDARWHHVQISVNFSWHEASEESGETDGEKLRSSANCFLTLFRVCVYRHIAGVVRSSQSEAEVMTMSGWHARTNPCARIMPHLTQ